MIPLMCKQCCCCLWNLFQKDRWGRICLPFLNTWYHYYRYPWVHAIIAIYIPRFVFRLAFTKPILAVAVFFWMILHDGVMSCDWSPEWRSSWFSFEQSRFLITDVVLSNIFHLFFLLSYVLKGNFGIYYWNYFSFFGVIWIFPLNCYYF